MFEQEIKKIALHYTLKLFAECERKIEPIRAQTSFVLDRNRKEIISTIALRLSKGNNSYRYLRILDGYIRDCVLFSTIIPISLIVINFSHLRKIMTSGALEPSDELSISLIMLTSYYAAVMIRLSFYCLWIRLSLSLELCRFR